MSKEREWQVTWVIEVDAVSAKEAAAHALEIMRDKESTATHFVVVEKKDGSCGVPRAVHVDEENDRIVERRMRG